MTDIGTGLFLGGVARQRNIDTELGLRDRAVGVQENQLQFQQQTQQRNEVMEAIGNTIEQTVNFIKSHPDRSAPAFKEFIDTARNSISGIVNLPATQALGILPDSVFSTFDNAVLGTQTATEAAAAEAQAGVAGATVTGAAAAGASTATQVALGVQNAPVAAVSPEAQAQALERIGARPGKTAFDVADPAQFATALTTPTTGDVERLRTNVLENQANFETASNSLKAVQDAGALSVGFVGAGVESFSGIMGNLGALGEAINAGLESVTGADLEKLTAARTSLREGVADALPEITGDSNRFTKDERELANNVLRGMTPDASIGQVIAAYEQYFSILNASDIRNAREIVRGAEIDLGTSTALNPAGVDQLGTLLRSLGMSEARILEILDQVVPR